MAFAFILPLRAVQALLSIVVLGLTAYIISDYWSDFSPDSVDFMLFTSIWTLLAVAYLVIAPSRFPALAHKYAIAAVEALTMLFWFAAWVAVAAYRGNYPHCGAWGGCKASVAAIVFGVILWLTFLATTILSVLHIRRTARGDTAPPAQMQGV